MQCKNLQDQTLLHTAKYAPAMIAYHLGAEGKLPLQCGQMGEVTVALKHTGNMVPATQKALEQSKVKYTDPYHHDCDCCTN